MKQDTLIGLVLSTTHSPPQNAGASLKREIVIHIREINTKFPPAERGGLIEARQT